MHFAPAVALPVLWHLPKGFFYFLGCWLICILIHLIGYKRFELSGAHVGKQVRLDQEHLSRAMTAQSRGLMLTRVSMHSINGRRKNCIGIPVTFILCYIFYKNLR